MRLCNIDFSPDYHPCLIGQHIQAMGLHWLHPDSQTGEQIVEAAFVEQYVAILTFKPKSWVLCQKPTTLEETINLVEAYSSMEAGM